MPFDYTYVPFIKSSRKRPKKTNLPKYVNIKRVKEVNVQNHFGKILLGSTNNVLPTDWNMCKCLFKSFDKKDVVSLQFDDDNKTVIINILNDFNFVKDLFNFKVFEVNFEAIDEQIYLVLYFSQLPLPKFNPRIGKMIKICFSLLYNIPQEDAVQSNKKQLYSAQEINMLFKEINEIRTLEDLESIDVKTTCLNPRLRPYQENAVKWMIHRENQQNAEGEMLHPLYEEIKLESGTHIYYNKYDGYIDVTKPVVHNPKTGGILADEMGLGKTVEVLALILSNRKNEEEYMSDVSRPVKIETQPRKVIPKSQSNEVAFFRLEESKPKKIKLSPEFIKGSSKKSMTYMALEKWYENKLQEVSKKKETVKETVFCICGNNSIENTVQCLDCLNYQHSLCLGYKKSYGKYRCLQCWAEQPLIECGATLIVCPASLKKQWCSEISKHVKGGLKVLLYEGTRVMPVYPTRIKKFDIVLTTYNVLTAEFRLLGGAEQTCVRRRNPKYAAFNSPLLRVKWWRLCLDEAQTVDVPGRMVSEMAGKLNATHRWAVTGTPISKSISDLFGLIDYLHFEPYCDMDIWTHKLYYPYLLGNKKPMLDFLVKIFWRSTKAEVIDQINIPQQSTEMHWLELSAVEKYFYTREHELCCSDMLKQLQNFTDLSLPLKLLDKSVLKKLLSPLLSLRQTCSHPNVVRGRYLATRKQVNSMEDLLEALIMKNKNDSEECLRLIVSSLNGLAGIYLLLQKPDEAIENYRKVLQLNARFNKSDAAIKLTIDKLQLIHTMYNLSEILEINPTTEHTLRDSSLKEECALLEQQYIEKSISNTFAVLQETANFSAQINQLQTEFILPQGQWYVDLINWITMCDFFDDFKNRLETVEDTNGTKLNFVNHDHFKNLIGMWDEEVNYCRTTTINAINNLYVKSDVDDFKITIPQKTVQEAIDCHLQPQKKNKKKTCSICIANKYLVEYESKIFLSTVRVDDEKAISNLGSWKSSQEELTLKVLLQLGKAKNADHDIIKDGQLHSNIINLIKKEFKAVRKLWTYLDEYVCKMSEVNTSKIRLRLKTKTVEEKRNKVSNILKQLTNVQENKIQAIHMLEEHELDYQKSVLTSEEQMNMIKLERYLGTSKYLETLRIEQKEGNTDPCPICKSALVDHWSVLMCGHSYCMDCIQALLEQTHSSKITCSICRQKQNVQDITYLHTSQNLNKGSDVKGNYSSKIAAITQLLIKLNKEDESVKVLIFSKWLSVLKVIRLALEENEIKSEIVTSRIDKSVDIFKTDKSITALLLPIIIGSKGLNLIEATHIILVEPLLNPGEELQAIGRIHRIGQTKPTVVHKFLMKNTIEESIHHATTLNTNSWDDNKVTLLQLKNLFVNTSEDEVADVEEVNNDSVQ